MKLSHVDAAGRGRMGGVAGKPVTLRTAGAGGGDPVSAEGYRPSGGQAGGGRGGWGGGWRGGAAWGRSGRPGGGDAQDATKLEGEGGPPPPGPWGGGRLGGGAAPRRGGGPAGGGRPRRAGRHALAPTVAR